MPLPSLRDALTNDTGSAREALPAPEVMVTESLEMAEARRHRDDLRRDERERAWMLAGLPASEFEEPSDEHEIDEEDGPPMPDPPLPSGRRRRAVAGHTIDLRRVPFKERQRLRLLHPPEDYWRPKRRGDCAAMPRPCPYVGCSWHLLLDVTDTGASLKLNFPDLVEDRLYRGPLREDETFFTSGQGRLEAGPFLEEMEATCALDVADRGGCTHEELGPLINLSRERIRQMEEEVFGLLRDARKAKTLADLFDLKRAPPASPPALEPPPAVSDPPPQTEEPR